MLVTTRILAALNESITWNRQSSLTEYTRSTLWNSSESVWKSVWADTSPRHTATRAITRRTGGPVPPEEHNMRIYPAFYLYGYNAAVAYWFFLKTSTLQALPRGVSGNIGRIWKWQCVLEGRGWSFPVGMGISKYTVLFSKRQWDIKKP